MPPPDSSLNTPEENPENASSSDAVQLPAWAPPWLLKHCVKSAGALNSLSIPLVAAQTSDGQVGDTATSGPEAESAAHRFEIEPVVYDALRIVLSKPTQNLHDNSTAGQSTRFRKTRVLLTTPTLRDGRGGPMFLQSVMELFAREVNADLVTLGLDDMKDLAQYSLSNAGQPVGSAKSNLATYEKACKASLSLIFESQAQERPVDNSSACSNPLIVHIPEVHQFSQHGSVLDAIDDAIPEARRSQGEVLLACTSHTLQPSRPSLLERLYHSDRSDQKGCVMASFDPENSITLAPVCSEAQLGLLEEGLPGSNLVLRANVRLVQSKMREMTRDFSSPEVEPYAEWALPKGCEAVRNFGDQTLAPGEAEYLAAQVGGTFDPQHISRALKAAHRRKTLMLDWDSSAAKDQWSVFPPGVRESIRKIEQNVGKFKYEGSFLDALVKPDSVMDKWSDIEIDAGIKKTMVQVITEFTNPVPQLSGILARARVGGALLYGPPGTGKTHLARVMAHVCNATMIAVSSADISSKWVGETEKAIKGLFSLGRLLSPSVIFIDEADSLLGARTSTDPSWVRNSINQFLAEMDGLIKARSTSFVLLATNFPQALDSAALRRVPCKLAIGLPGFSARQKIFGICLRDDSIADDVTLNDLARRTEGYSGADIQAACVHAAITCNADTANTPGNGDGTHKTPIRLSHFLEGLRRSPPTVTEESLSTIRDFAKANDPASLDATMQDEAQVVYSELPRCGPREIRVITIQVATDAENGNTGEAADGKIRCQLETVSLDDQAVWYHDALALRDDESARDPSIPPVDALSVSQLSDLSDAMSQFGPRSREARQALRAAAHSPSTQRFEDFGRRDDFGRLDARFKWGDYIAMSYTWGKPKPLRHIVVNGCRFAVGENLHAMLQRLGKSAEVRERGFKVWIDAICINQGDTGDKETEVGKMGFIYKNALVVRGWIGNPSPLPVSPAELESFQKWLASAQYEPWGDTTKPMDTSAIPDDVLRPVARTACAIGGMPYWGRLWVVQETLIPTSLKFWYGDHLQCTPVEIFLLFKIAIDFYGRGGSAKHATQDELIGLTMAVRRIASRAKYRGEAHSKVRVGAVDNTPDNFLEELIYTAMYCKAKDPRDKVYGLLALLTDNIRNRIPLLYSVNCTARDTYLAFTKACILDTGNLDAVAGCIRSHHRNSKRRMPSWAVDLSPDSWVNPVEGTDRCIAARANKQTEHVPIFSPDDIMCCEGIFVDSILTLAHLADLEELVSEQTTIGGRPGQPGQPANDDQAVPPPPHVDENLRRALARVVHLDVDYAKPLEESFLGLPWDSDDQALSFGEHTTEFNATPKVLNPASERLREVLHANADFLVYDVPLRHYFAPTRKEPRDNVRDRTGQTVVSVGMIGRICTTESKLVGRVPRAAKVGDKIAVLFACKMPVVLRPKGDKYFEWIGTCFVEGLMRGEAIDSLKRGRFCTTTISIC